MRLLGEERKCSVSQSHMTQGGDGKLGLSVLSGKEERVLVAADTFCSLSSGMSGQSNCKGHRGVEQMESQPPPWRCLGSHFLFPLA